MSEEKTALSPQEKGKSRPVWVYLTILFLVAFLLLVISFFMQQRNQETLEALHESLGNTQDLNELRLENQRLTFEITQLQEDNKELEEALSQQEAQAQEKEKEAQALEWLREIERVSRSSGDRARELMAEFEAAGLVDALPSQPVVEGGSSPAESYGALRERFR